MYSDEYKVDWRGLVTRPNNWDPIHPSQRPIKFSKERKLPFTRTNNEDEPPSIFL
jgi:hypothetical protein